MSYNLLGFLILSLLAILAAFFFSGIRRSWIPSSLFIGAILFRIIGSTIRYEVLFRYYNGFGDAVRYFNEGRMISEIARISEWPFFSLFYWFGESIGDLCKTPLFAQSRRQAQILILEMLPVFLPAP